MDQFQNKWAKNKSGSWAVAESPTTPSTATTPTTTPSRRRRVSTATKAAETAKVQLQKWLPELAPPRKIVGYNRNGQAIKSDQAITATNYDPTSGKLLVANKDYFPTPVDSTANTTKAPESTSDREARTKIFKNQNLVNNGISLATGLAGAVAFKNTDVPEYQPSEEYQNMQAEIAAMKNQGFSSEEKAAFNRDINQSYANGVAAIEGATGGGATQGAVLSSLGSLNKNINNAYLDRAVQDAGMRRRNRSIYNDSVSRDEQMNFNAFQGDRQMAMEERAAALSVVAQSAQDLYDQNQYVQSYGPDSLYNELQETALARTQSYNDLAKLQSQLALAQINTYGEIPVTPTSEADLIKTASSPAYSNPLKRRQRQINF